MEFVTIPWLVLLVLVVWWAGVWGRSMFWAALGSILLTPVVWAVVLLILGRNPGAPRP